MFVPTVPYVPSATVINKTVVYSDTVLPLKDIGDNLKVTSIKNVSKFSLENSLKTIFESNPNVVFNTIQYSEKDKTVYFYTNQEISTKEYEESRFTSYKPLTSRTELLEEIKRVLLSETNTRSDCISLYDVAKHLRKIYDNYSEIKERYNRHLNNIVESKCHSDSLITIHGMDYKTKILKISFKYSSYSEWDDIEFDKKDGDLYIVKSDSCYNKEIFEHLSSELSKLYDKLIIFAGYIDNPSYDIKTVNSRFKADVSFFEVSIEASPSFELSKPNYKSEYSLKCNSSIIHEALKDDKAAIFRKIFVRIDDCPKWCQEALYKIRQEELKEVRTREEKQQRIEEKQQKRLALKRKIFPFLKEDK